MWGGQATQPPQYDDDIWDESEDSAPATVYVQQTRTFNNSSDSNRGSFNTDPNRR